MREIGPALTKELVITSSMQTAAGRLLFARVDMAEMETSDREHAIQEHRPPSRHDSDEDLAVDDRGFSDGYGETEDQESGENDDSGVHPVKPASINGPRIVNRPSGSGMKGTPRNPRR